jgi:hypothetical protein
MTGICFAKGAIEPFRKSQAGVPFLPHNNRPSSPEWRNNDSPGQLILPDKRLIESGSVDSILLYFFQHGPEGLQSRNAHVRECSHSEATVALSDTDLSGSTVLKCLSASPSN